MSDLLQGLKERTEIVMLSVLVTLLVLGVLSLLQSPEAPKYEVPVTVIEIEGIDNDVEMFRHGGVTCYISSRDDISCLKI